MKKKILPLINCWRISPRKGNWRSCPPICCVHSWRIWKALFFPVLIWSSLYWSELLQMFGLQGLLSPTIASASRTDQHCCPNPIVQLNMSPLLLKNCWNGRKWKSHKSIFLVFLFFLFSRPRRIKLWHLLLAEMETPLLKRLKKIVEDQWLFW